MACRGSRWRSSSAAPGTALNLGWRQRAAAAAALVAVGALALRRPRAAAAGLGAMILPNMSFYVLLGRRGGMRLALAGVPLHLVHHLTAALSIPAGVALWARSGRR